MPSLGSSFRDPSGFVFKHDGRIYRQVNQVFSQSFDSFLDSGLYGALVEKGLLISHQEISEPDIPTTSDAYRVLKPQQINFISYPYEWSFSQLKDAAMLTLRIQALALKHGFTLKDASSYNVQFIDSRPIFIDTLSFEPHRDGAPWVAYRQFCQHFLAPLALMAYKDIELGKILISHIDGVPLSLASKLLPLRTHLNYGIQTHIHLHSRLQSDYADSAGENSAATGRSTKAKDVRLSSKGLRAILDSLATTVNRLEWNPPKTEWGDYYEHTNYSDDAARHKRQIVDEFLGTLGKGLNIIQDLGSNTGEFSRIAAKYCKLVVSQDIDPVAVEINYRQTKMEKPRNLLPLVQNLFSPSPAIGWANEERESFSQRAQCDAILALALVHHLAISNNLPLAKVAEFFASITNWLVIEFVPKSDSQVRRLLETREDVFHNYTETGFLQAFSLFFSIEKKRGVEGSDRAIFLMRSIT